MYGHTRMCARARARTHTHTRARARSLPPLHVLREVLESMVTRNSVGKSTALLLRRSCFDSLEAFSFECLGNLSTAFHISFRKTPHTQAKRRCHTDILAIARYVHRQDGGGGRRTNRRKDLWNQSQTSEPVINIWMTRQFFDICSARLIHYSKSGRSETVAGSGTKQMFKTEARIWFLTSELRVNEWLCSITLKNMSFVEIMKYSIKDLNCHIKDLCYHIAALQ